MDRNGLRHPFCFSQFYMLKISEPFGAHFAQQFWFPLFCCNGEAGQRARVSLKVAIDSINGMLLACEALPSGKVLLPTPWSPDGFYEASSGVVVIGPLNSPWSRDELNDVGLHGLLICCFVTLSTRAISQTPGPQHGVVLEHLLETLLADSVPERGCILLVSLEFWGRHI